MTTNIFYRLPGQHGVKSASVRQPCDIDAVTEYLKQREGLVQGSYRIVYQRQYYKTDAESNDNTILQGDGVIDVVIPLLGGKGGFGSLLRAIGAQIEKTTNRDACRDLSGRRLRDIKREDDLKKLLALQEKLIEEKKRRKRDKIDKLKRKQEASSASISIQELVSMFEDQDYNKRRLEVSDIIDAAMEKGIINFKKRQMAESAGGDARTIKKNKLESDETDEPQGICTKRPTDDAKKCDDSRQSPDRQHNRKSSKPKKGAKKKDLWLGIDEDDDESDDGDET